MVNHLTPTYRKIVFEDNMMVFNVDAASRRVYIKGI
jgi:hypothetical protein